jgi:hypothetical protein
MVDLADHLARFTEERVGMLNPSHPHTVWAGTLGNSWDGGPIGREEILALRTTLLAGHVSLHPAPWNPAANSHRVYAPCGAPRDASNEGCAPPPPPR